MRAVRLTVLPSFESGSFVKLSFSGLLCFLLIILIILLHDFNIYYRVIRSSLKQRVKSWNER